MAIGEIFDETPTVLASSAGRSVFAAHGILCPCPGCKGAINATNAGTGTVASTGAGDGTDGDSIHRRSQGSMTAREIRAGFLRIGVSASDERAISAADRSRYGKRGGLDIEAAQLLALCRMDPRDISARVQNGLQKCTV